MIVGNGNGQSVEYLDPYCGKGEVRIEVAGLCAVEKVQELYFVRSASFRILWNYFLEIGARSLIAKVRSRRAERARNAKWILIGYGKILESCSGSVTVGDRVAFVAPKHPACVDRVVVSEKLVKLLELSELEPLLWRPDRCLVQKKSFPGASFLNLSGWDPDSGSECQEIKWEEVVTALRDCDWTSVETVKPATGIKTKRSSAEAFGAGHDAIEATLFGYGNYAKTVILPSLPNRLHVARIHEIDPLQIPENDKSRCWDTAPIPGMDDRSVVWFIAGYHHSHSKLAIEALERGRVAVSEKPLVVDELQMRDLADVLERTGGRYFACFHKRYSPFNEMAIKDLRVEEGTPISYHCIVYEVPLPSRHWYRWPNSHSRIISNGCHWIDHFLFLNGYGDVRSADATASSAGDINVSVELESGAFFTMVLTDNGGSRTGMQDYIELRTIGRTVRIENSSKYRAESDSRIVRESSINKMLSYRTMYKTIGEAVLSGRAGDSIRSVIASGELVLNLDAKVGGKST